MNKNKTIEELEGVWPDQLVKTGLIARCLAARKKPISQLSNLELATLINQGIGVKYILDEARVRVFGKYNDDTELFDGQLSESIKKIETKLPGESS